MDRQECEWVRNLYSNFTGKIEILISSLKTLEQDSKTSSIVKDWETVKQDKEKKKTIGGRVHYNKFEWQNDRKNSKGIL